MRKLLLLNYKLKYTKFSLENNVVYLKFQTNALSAGSYKLYDALKEMARNADKIDDLLVSEFSSVVEINTFNNIEISSEIKEIKYKYLLKWINETLEEINKFDPEKFNAAISFILLGLLQKIDYLLVSQGNLTDKLEHLHRAYFLNSDKTTLIKNNELIDGFTEILNFNKEDILKGFYRVKSTFPYLNPTNRNLVLNKIVEERKKIDWYSDNKYSSIVAKMYEYIASYCFFNYGMGYVERQLLDLMLQLQNQDFYTEMGFDQNVLIDKNPNKDLIIKRLRQIEKLGKEKYPKLNIAAATLKYDNTISFIDSLMYKMTQLDFTE